MRHTHERLLWLLLIGTGLFNKADYFLTLDALGRGFYEANPVLAPMIGTYEFPLVKLLLVPLMLYLLWRIRHLIGRRIVAYAFVPFVSYFSLMLYFHIYVG